MKKLLSILGFVAIATSLTSCACNCYTDPNNNQTTICKSDYENAWGAGTWESEGAPAYRNAGWQCQN